MRTDAYPFRSRSIEFSVGLDDRRFSEPGGLEFSIFRLEDLAHTNPNADKPHRHSYFEIIWKTKGEGSCWLDQQYHELKNDSIFIIPPGHIHSLHNRSDAGGYVILCSKDFIYLTPGFAGNGFYYDLLMNSGIFMLDGDNEKADLENILYYTKREFDKFSLARPEILGGWLRMFLTYLKDLCKPANLSPDHSKNIELVKKFYSLLERDFLKRKMVADYARDLSISPNYLNEMVKRVSGFTASYHIQQRIVLEAKRLAIYSASSMKEIAYLLGFEDIAYFSKYFKIFSGTNFRVFKKLHSKGDA